MKTVILDFRIMLENGGVGEKMAGKCVFVARINCSNPFPARGDILESKDAVNDKL